MDSTTIIICLPCLMVAAGALLMRQCHKHARDRARQEPTP